MLDFAGKVLIDCLMVHSSVSKNDGTLSNFRNFRVVGDDHECGAIHVQFTEQFHDDLFIRFIQVSGRFICKNDLRIVDQSAGDTYSLLLAA